MTMKLFVIGALAMFGVGCSTVCASIPLPIVCDKSCPYDCDGNKKVDVVDLTILAAIASGAQPLSACPKGDTNGNGKIDKSEQSEAQAQAEAGTVCK